MTYLLDANVFIQAKNEYYGFDIVPAFWDWLIAANKAGTVFSIDKVGDELFEYGDELSDWAKDRAQTGGFFLQPDDAVLDALKAREVGAGPGVHRCCDQRVPGDRGLLPCGSCVRP
jgi:hypothetical protein